MQTNITSSHEVEETPEQVKKRKTITELHKVVCDSDDRTGLYGHQPTLVRIRQAYQAGECDLNQLEILLEALYAKTEGEEEPFESAKAFYKYMFPTLSTPEPKPELSKAEQAKAIKAILGKDMKKTPKRKSAPKPVAAKIDTSLIPEHLKQFL